MKVNDIIESGYGLRQGTAMSRSVNSKQTNQNIRINARTADANREAGVAQQHSYRSEKRRRKAPTGIPSRLLQPQTPAGPEGGQR